MIQYVPTWACEVKVPYQDPSAVGCGNAVTAAGAMSKVAPIRMDIGASVRMMLHRGMHDDVLASPASVSRLRSLRSPDLGSKRSSAVVSSLRNRDRFPVTQAKWYTLNPQVCAARTGRLRPMGEWSGWERCWFECCRRSNNCRPVRVHPLVCGTACHQSAFFRKWDLYTVVLLIFTALVRARCGERDGVGDGKGSAATVSHFFRMLWLTSRPSWP